MRANSEPIGTAARQGRLDQRKVAARGTADAQRLQLGERWCRATVGGSDHGIAGIRQGLNLSAVIDICNG